jgi:hypothetical protein
MTLVFDKVPFYARNALDRNVESHLKSLAMHEFIGPGYERLSVPPIPLLTFGVVPPSGEHLRRLVPGSWAVLFISDKGIGKVELDRSWRPKVGMSSRGNHHIAWLYEHLKRVDRESSTANARFVRIPNLHVYALWITDADGDRFFVYYRFKTKDPIPETMGIDQFLAFVGELAAANDAAYERSRQRAIKRGQDPKALVG